MSEIFPETPPMPAPAHVPVPEAAVPDADEPAVLFAGREVAGRTAVLRVGPPPQA